VTLAERIYARMVKDPGFRRRLDGVPPAVVEDVLRMGILTLAAFVPMETHASDLADIEFDACEGCGHLIDPAEPEGSVYQSEDGIWLCNACAVEDALPPSPSGEGAAKGGES
jgi:hypothetical protein